MNAQPAKLTLDILQSAVAGHAAALRRITTLQPAGGPGDKVFPPTYEGGKYATEKRVIEGGEIADCVLLDSVQSQANRMELALLDALRARRIELPLLTVRFDDPSLRKRFTVTSLEAPHRIADALLRDSLCGGTVFRKSEKGRVLDDAEPWNATGLFGLNPTALLFGLWDSTGPRGGLGVKFQRALVSEIVGISVQPGVKTSSRLDPAQVMLASGPVYARAESNSTDPEWTLDPTLALKEKGQAKKLGKDGKPSESNHGNVTPGIVDGGFTLTYARQTTVLSLPALRRLRFPVQDRAESDPARDAVARTALAALGLLGATLAAEAGADLRSRCLLVPTEPFEWELLGPAPAAAQRYELDGDGAIALFAAAVDRARSAGLPWEGEIILTPTTELTRLVAKSQDLSSQERA
ncbi:MAG: type I-U CRISPR-associated protein Cas7 [Burkholderiales bacterium]|nr:type I-U CRISPR-associated protein Cas7 [Burkholderiales bacterium]MDE1926901.1 type I-U CRISPR-associated protein Cas7 [Burkholderiales bacterium]MDE2157520.1 type I-U CRISPR-associated protein Cas7 [Burkholderiales bacterium]MDE2501726.1 type I-U CRISPR-associated protein Cas7 [Burkholderiales bacterium]